MMRLPTATRLHKEAAERLGWSFELLDSEHGYLFELRNGDVRRTFLGGRSRLNDAVAARLAEDKYYTTVLLERASVPTPSTRRCLSPSHANHRRCPELTGMSPGHGLASDVGYPVIVKPNRLSHGRGVTLVSNADALERAIEAVWQLDAIALVQPCVKGRDIRLDFVDGDYLAGYERVALSVTGDGERTIGELLRDADPRLEDPERLERLTARLGEETRRVLKLAEAWSFGGPIQNLNLTSTAHVIESPPPELQRLCVRAGDALGLRHYGIDLKVDGDTAAVIEVNASPLLSQIYLMGHQDTAIAAQTKVLRAVFQRAASAPIG